ncbi:unnamed protein product, partial [Brenthis ino]
MADAEQNLREILDKILDEEKYCPREIKIQAITSGGANYTSAIFLVKVTSPNRDDLNLFAKVAMVSEVMRTRLNIEWLYDTEKFVYTKLVKVYKDIEEKLNVPQEYRYVFPKCYGCNAEHGKEIVVMENLIEDGYKSYNRFKSMDWEHASKGVENLAKFHALSFAFAKYQPEEFQQVAEDIRYKIAQKQSEEPNGIMAGIWDKMVNNAVSVIKEDQRDAVKKFFDSNIQLHEYNRALGKPVIAHGDYRMSNLLFKKQDKEFNAIAVDYQTVHAGNPITDLFYFIFLGSDEEFRKQHYEELLDHYYKSLVQALERLSVDPVEVYPRNKFDSDLKEILPYGLLLGAALLPIVTVEAESAPKLDGTTDVHDFLIKSNDLYASRFSGIVNDYIAWGVIQ